MSKVSLDWLETEDDSFVSDLEVITYFILCGPETCWGYCTEDGEEDYYPCNDADEGKSLAAKHWKGFNKEDVS